MDLSPVDPLQKSPGVSQAADCCRPEHQIVDLEFCLLDAVVGVEAQAAHCPEGVCRSIFPFQGKVGRPQSRLHDAAGGPEDDSGSGPLPHGAVAFNIV